MSLIDAPQQEQSSPTASEPSAPVRVMTRAMKRKLDEAVESGGAAAAGKKFKVDRFTSGVDRQLRGNTSSRNNKGRIYFFLLHLFLS